MSFVAVVVSLMIMDLSTLTPSVPTERAKGQLREGFRYIAATPKLLYPLIMMSLVGMLAYEFQVTLPIVAGRVFHGNSEDYGLMMASMGVGAIIGGLWTASRGKTGTRAITRAALLFGAFITLAALSPRMGIEFAALALVGFASVAFLVHDELDTATGDRPADAGTGDGVVGGRLHGNDADWWTAHRLDHQ